MTAAYKPTAAGQMRQALADIKRRPPDITGVVQHGMAALECTARDVTGQPSANLGQILPALNLPRALARQARLGPSSVGRVAVVRGPKALA